MNEGTSLISVIIPCYNNAHFLGEAIESAFCQTYQNVEVIVVDDGSPDNAAEVAARYERVHCVRQANRGIAEARNTGIKESGGESLVFLDADDRLLPHALEVHLDYFKSYPECVLICGHRTLIAEDGSPLPAVRWPCTDSDHYLHLLRHCYIGPPAAVMYRREIFDRVGLFDQSIAPSADWDMYMRIARSHPIRCHHQVVAEYRIHGANVSRKIGSMFISTLNTLQKQWGYVKSDPQLQEAYRSGQRGLREFYGELLINKLRLEVRSGDWKNATASLAILCRRYPGGVIKHGFRKLRCLLRGEREASDDLSVDVFLVSTESSRKAESHNGE